jgi:GNAT superfamily N-acetyltransferase
MTISKAMTMDWGGTALAQTAPSGVDQTASSLAEEIVVSTAASREDLSRLLECLSREDSAHSWKNFDRAGSLEELLRWENSRRPTEIFFFYLRRGEDLQIFGAGAVAAHLNSRFPEPGFCVLGRCYIMTEFRGRGFYRRVLQHRLEHCRTRFGRELKAVHIGSDNERVAHVVTRQPLPGWPRFLHLGQEELAIAGRTKLVCAYMMLMPDFARNLARTLEGPGAPPGLEALRDRLAGLGRDDAENLGLAVRDAVAGARTRGWLADRDTGPINQLLAFCKAVPLVGFK